MTKTSRDYEVGYKRPPAETRYRAGQSGNPFGRPKRPESSNEILDMILKEKVTIKIRGRDRRVTMKEVLLRQLFSEGMKGNARALMAILNRETDRMLDENARMAKDEKWKKVFAAEFSQLLERVRSKQKAEEQTEKAKRSEWAEPDLKPPAEKKLYDPK